MIERKIFFRNNRLGPISSLTFEDAHQPGLAMSVQQATNQTSGPDIFRATFDANFFSNFGDGDNFLESGEQAVLIQRVVIDRLIERLRMRWSMLGGTRECVKRAASALAHEVDVHDALGAFGNGELERRERLEAGDRVELELVLAGLAEPHEQFVRGAG